jgi:hypothetical protein
MNSNNARHARRMNDAHDSARGYLAEANDAADAASTFGSIVGRNMANARYAGAMADLSRCLGEAARHMSKIV